VVDQPSADRRKRFRVDDLFTDTSARGAGVSDLFDAKLIQLGRIQPDPDQPRREFDEEALAELAASIQAEGVLQPIAVRYDAEQDTYVILHGERRWRAAHLAGLESIPAIVREVPAERRLIQQLMENVVREDLNALDRAAALRALKKQLGDAPWEQVAEAVGIRRSRLFQLLGTEKLTEQLQAALRQGIVSEKQTRSAQSLTEALQRELSQRLEDGRLSPADLERAARSLQKAKSLSDARDELDRTKRGAGGRDALAPVVQRMLRQSASLAETLVRVEYASLSPVERAAVQRDLKMLGDDIQRVLEAIASR
jgi:ParB family chromosome partitioning protein